MSEEWKAQYNKAGRLWFWGVDAQENPGGTPEARSHLCVCLVSCHGQDSSRWLLASAMNTSSEHIMAKISDRDKKLSIVISPNTNK